MMTKNEWNDKIFKDMTQGTRILLTGATGLVGRALIRRFISQKAPANLILLVRDRQKAKEMIEAMLGKEGQGRVEPRFTFVEGDIMNEITVDGPIDWVIHGASITKSADMTAHPVETFLTCVEGTHRVLELARRKKVKSMVYLSSMEMYGTFEFPGEPSGGGKNGGDDLGCQAEPANFVTEEMLGYLDLSGARSSYPEGKRAAEMLCAAYFREYSVPVKIARLAQTFGEGVSREETRVFAQFARSAMSGEDITLHTDGSSEGNYCCLSDTVDGILTILQGGRDGESYNVANEALHMTIAGMAQFVADKVAPGVCGHTLNVVFDIPAQENAFGYAQKTKLFLSAEKLRMLGWRPEYGMMEMYMQMIGEWQR